MNNELTKQSADILQKLILTGDLSGMTPDQKVMYYKQFCESLGINPLTEPFAILKLNGKEKMYAKKDAAEQLRKIHGISITDMTTEESSGVYRVIAKARDKDGKTDVSTGVVSIEGLKGEALSNAMMKAETKAKRRVTLSIAGLGLLDESEVRDIQDVEVTSVVTEPKKPKITDKGFATLMAKLEAPGADIDSIVKSTTSTINLTNEQADLFTKKVSELQTTV